jgi:hypothetical protein
MMIRSQALRRTSNWSRIFFVFIAFNAVYFAGASTSMGTLVVAVPVREGLVVCADKRLSNAADLTFTDSNLKLRRAGNNALYAATSTVGFYDDKAGKMAFNVFDVTSGYVDRAGFSVGREFWDGLKKEIRGSMDAYFRAHTYAEWPESDGAGSDLLFNLIFFSIEGGRAWSHQVSVHYIKARTPVVSIVGPIREEIRTTKLVGKGKEVISYLERSGPTLDRSMLKFGASNFNVSDTSAAEATRFAKSLICLASSGVPEAFVSPASDCASLSHSTGVSETVGGN